MYFFGSLYVLTIVLLFFKKEKDEVDPTIELDEGLREEDEESLKTLPVQESTIDKKKNKTKKKLSLFSAYKYIWRLLTLKPIQLMAIVLLTCKV